MLLTLTLLAHAVRALYLRAAAFTTDWLLEPGLLLAGVLFGTIGVQMNMYVFKDLWGLNDLHSSQLYLR